MSDRPHALVLFDIDGTLVDCGKASGKGFSKAFAEAFGIPCPIFEPEEVAGLTDSAILLDVLKKLNHHADDRERRRDLAFEMYARYLAREFELLPARELPGAANAVRAVRSVPGCVAGLLTGSTRATARIKLASAGIDFGLFACGAYSEDGELREELPPVAQDRFASLFARRPQVTILVGDTPRDVQAALATGCAFIGVTTGHYDRAALESAGARTVLEDLTAANSFLQAVASLL